MQLLYITIIKQKEEEDMICNFLKDANRPLTFYRLICVFVLKPFFKFVFVFLVFVVFIVRFFFIQDDFFNFCKTLMYPSRYYIEKKKTQSI